jgi:hypothetical protein
VGSTFSWKYRQAFESHGCLTRLSPLSRSLLFSLFHRRSYEIAGLLNILCTRGMIGKCLSTFTGNFFRTWSLYLGFSYFRQFISFASSPQKAHIHFDTHGWCYKPSLASASMSSLHNGSLVENSPLGVYDRVKS